MSVQNRSDKTPRMTPSLTAHGPRANTSFNASVIVPREPIAETLPANALYS